MTDENSTTVWTTQTSQNDQGATSQSWNDFVLDFGDDESSTVGTWDDIAQDSSDAPSFVDKESTQDDFDFNINVESDLNTEKTESNETTKEDQNLSWEDINKNDNDDDFNMAFDEEETWKDSQNTDNSESNPKDDSTDDLLEEKWIENNELNAKAEENLAEWWDNSLKVDELDMSNETDNETTDEKSIIDSLGSSDDFALSDDLFNNNNTEDKSIEDKSPEQTENNSVLWDGLSSEKNDTWINTIDNQNTFVSINEDSSENLVNYSEKQENLHTNEDMVMDDREEKDIEENDKLTDNEDTINQEWVSSDYMNEEKPLDSSIEENLPKDNESNLLNAESLVENWDNNWTFSENINFDDNLEQNQNAEDGVLLSNSQSDSDNVVLEENNLNEDSLWVLGEQEDTQDIWNNNLSDMPTDFTLDLSWNTEENVENQENTQWYVSPEIEQSLQDGFISSSDNGDNSEEDKVPWWEVEKYEDILSSNEYLSNQTEGKPDNSVDFNIETLDQPQTGIEQNMELSSDTPLDINEENNVQNQNIAEPEENIENVAPIMEENIPQESVLTVDNWNLEENNWFTYEQGNSEENNVQDQNIVEPEEKMENIAPVVAENIPPVVAENIPQEPVLAEDNWNLEENNWFTYEQDNNQGEIDKVSENQVDNGLLLPDTSNTEGVENSYNPDIINESQLNETLNQTNETAQNVSTQSTLSLDDILDTELLADPQFLDNSVAMSKDMQLSWKESSGTKKIITAFVCLWVFVLAWSVAFLAFPDYFNINSGNFNWQLNEEIIEQQNINQSDIIDDHTSAPNWWLSSEELVGEEDDIFPENVQSDTEESNPQGMGDIVSENVPESAPATVLFPSVASEDEVDELNELDEEREEELIEEAVPYIPSEEDVWYQEPIYDSTLPLDVINELISSFKSEAEWYYSYWQESWDKNIIKYSRQIIYLCRSYEDKIKNGEWLDNASVSNFIEQWESLFARIEKEMNWWEELDVTTVQSIETDSNFDQKDEIKEYIENR